MFNVDKLKSKFESANHSSQKSHRRFVMKTPSNGKSEWSLVEIDLESIQAPPKPQTQDSAKVQKVDKSPQDQVVKQVQPKAQAPKAPEITPVPQGSNTSEISQKSQVPEVAKVSEVPKSQEVKPVQQKPQAPDVASIPKASQAPVPQSAEISQVPESVAKKPVVVKSELKITQPLLDIYELNAGDNAK
jgi:hypothetical protein